MRLSSSSSKTLYTVGNCYNCSGSCRGPLLLSSMLLSPPRPIGKVSCAINQSAKRWQNVCSHPISAEIAECAINQSRLQLTSQPNVLKTVKIEQWAIYKRFKIAKWAVYLNGLKLAKWAIYQMVNERKMANLPNSLKIVHMGIVPNDLNRAKCIQSISSKDTTIGEVLAHKYTISLLLKDHSHENLCLLWLSLVEPTSQFIKKLYQLIFIDLKLRTKIPKLQVLTLLHEKQRFGSMDDRNWESKISCLINTGPAREMHSLKTLSPLRT